MNNLNIKLEEIAFAIVAALSTIVSILDFSGGLDSIPWLSARIPTLTLLLLSVTSGYLVAEKRSQLKKLETLTQFGIEDIIKKITSSEDKISSIINGGEVKIFQNPDDMYKYLIDRYKRIRTTIDITYFGNTPPRHRQDGALDSTFYKCFAEIIKAGEIRVRRIALVRDKRSLDWIQETIDEFGDKSNFYLGCYPANQSKISLLSIMIIDNEEVLFTWGEKQLEFNRRTLSIRSTAFTYFCTSYFDNLWRESLIIKAREVNYAAFDELKSKIGP